jgi:myo-inositol-1-phosphate synthase
MHWSLGDYTPSSLEVVAAFDIDARKAGATR